MILPLQRQQGDCSLLGTANKHGIVKSSAKAWFFRICSTTQLIRHSPQLTKLWVSNTSKSSGCLTRDSSDTMRHHLQRLCFKHSTKSLNPLWLQSPAANETEILSRKIPIYCQTWQDFSAEKVQAWRGDSGSITRGTVNGITTTSKHSQHQPCSGLRIHKQLNQSNHHLCRPEVEHRTLPPPPSLTEAVAFHCKYFSEGRS